jgi:hypothetical protein
VNEVDLGLLLEQLAGKMRGRTGAGRGKRKRNGIAPRIVDQLCQILCRHRRIDDQQLRQCVQKSDRRKVALGIVIELTVDRRPDAERSVGTKENRVAIRARMSDGCGTNMPTSTRPIIDHHLLAEAGRQRRRDSAREHVR